MSSDVDAMPWQSLVALAERIVAIDSEGPRPADLTRYALKRRCEMCGRRVANQRAWTLKGGEGTNLCWGDCYCEARPSVTASDVVPLARAFLRLAESGNRVD